MPKTVERLVVVGLDGATWSVLDPMRARGLMPNLDAFLARAASGTLRSIIPPVTTAAWTSMVTGCGPARHGVFDHRYYDAGEGRLKVNHSGRIRVPTVWHLLASAGKSIVCLNVPGLYPPLKVPEHRHLRHGRPAPRRRTPRPPPSSQPDAPPRPPDMPSAISGSRVPPRPRRA